MRDLGSSDVIKAVVQLQRRMRTPEKLRPDEPLSRVLREWEVKSPLPLGFEAAVFRRIEESQRQSTSLWQRLEYWISTALAQPALATVLIAAFITLGLTAGWKGGREESARTRAELGERYLRSVSPQPSAHAEMK